MSPAAERFHVRDTEKGLPTRAESLKSSYPDSEIHYDGYGHVVTVHHDGMVNSARPKSTVVHHDIMAPSPIRVFANPGPL